MTLYNLTKQQHNKLCRMSQQGMVQAAEVLSRLLHQPVAVEVADAWVTECNLVDRLSPGTHLGVFMQVSGDIDGGLLMALTEDCASWLGGQLLGGLPDENLQAEPVSSTLKEVGNIIASSFLASLDDQLGLRAMPSPPQLNSGPLGELLQTCQVSSDEACLILKTRLSGAGDAAGNLEGAIYLFSKPAELKRLLEQIGSA